MATNQTPPPSPISRPSSDAQPSIRIRLAASMLCHGHHPLQVTDATGVPLALVELIHAEHHPHPPTNPAPTSPAGSTGPTLKQPGSALDDNPAGLTPNHAPLAADLGRRRTELVFSRWAARIRCTAVLAIVGNLILAIAADITHRPILAMAAVVLIPLLLTLLGLCALASASRPRSPRSH